MLQELSIENFAIIPQLRIQFKTGMTTLTGETGAGKSIIIDAVGLLVGGRASKEYIRQGAEKCIIEGLFSVEQKQPLTQKLVNLGIDFEDDNLILQREITKTGKSTCRINGRLVNLTTLRKIGSFLVDIHGQNEHQALMQPESHIYLLDAYGETHIQSLKLKYQDLFKKYRDIKEKVISYRKNEKELAQRIDMLKFQCNEISTAQLSIGEEEKLIEERNKLLNYKQITEALVYSYSILQGADSSTGGLDLIAMAMEQMEPIADLDDDYQKISEDIQSSFYLLQDAAGMISRNIDMLEMDDGRLNEVEGRLDTIQQLKHKYGDNITAILTYYDQIAKELTDIEFFDSEENQLNQILEEKETELVEVADQLTCQRKKIASKLEKQIQKQLTELYMEKTIFSVVFNTNSQFSEEGRDKVQFYISTNPGEPLKPLVKVASGGELSRIMLALKTIFVSNRGITSIIFDEVDTGVSGRVAEAIAQKIHQIAKHSQVLCITHLPQVAAAADTQYHIEKMVEAGRTRTTILRLTDQERVKEIARMLAGSEITTLTLEHAAELLSLAHEGTEQK